MKVREIMTAQIEMIDCNSTVEEAAQKMQRFDLGLLPVNEGPNKVIGVVTDRDIVLRTIAQNRDPRKTKIRDIMTPNVTRCSQEDTIQEAAKLLEEKHIHRLLVCDDQNRPVGILSLTDLARKSRDEHLAWEVLEKVCEPAHFST